MRVSTHTISVCSVCHVTNRIRILFFAPVERNQPDDLKERRDREQSAKLIGPHLSVDIDRRGHGYRNGHAWIRMTTIKDFPPIRNGPWVTNAEDSVRH